MSKLVSSIARWDILFLTSIFGLNSRRLLSTLLPWISHSANGYYYPAIPLFLFMVEPAIAVRFFRAAVLAFALERLLYKLIKSSVKRDRPCAVLANIQHRVTPPDQFSFPSGHTAAAFVICTLICYYFPILIVPVLAWALLVGLSRIYLGVHYPTDILAGMLIGTSSGATGLLLFG